MRSFRNIILTFALLGGLFYISSMSNEGPSAVDQGAPADVTQTAVGNGGPQAAADPAAQPQTTTDRILRAGIRGLFGGMLGENTRVSGVKISAFPRAYDAWRRTDYLGPQNAHLALVEMGRRVGNPVPTEGETPEDVTGRTAAIYANDNGRDVLMIYVEIRRPAARQRLDPTQTPPPPQTTQPTETGLSLGELETRLAEGGPVFPPVTNDASAPVVEDPVQDAPAVELGGRRFVDRSGGRRGIVDLEAVYDDRITMIVQGRTSLRVAESFVLDFNFSSLGVGG